MQLIGDWRAECPSRGPGLFHAHWRECDPAGVHPGTDERHEWRQCCHCGQLFGDSGNDIDRLLKAEPTSEPVNEDEPLSLPQPGDPCSWRHAAIAVSIPLIGENGLEWPICSNCGVPVEPQLATGELVGPQYGPGKGWVTERMRRRWAAIKYRFRQAPPDPNLGA